MKKHVLVLALSAFSTTANPYNFRLNRYVYEDKASEDKSSERKFYCEGYQQQEVIPLFIKNKLQEEITDFIIIPTTKVLTEERLYTLGAEEQQYKGTVWDYYVGFLKTNFPEAEIHKVVFEENSDGSLLLNEVMQTIRNLRAKSSSESEWMLWFDSHGGFRDVTVSLVTASRLLAMGEDMHIRTDGIFSVLFSWTAGEPSVIVDQTAFYFADSTEALKDYLNYGQYLNVNFNAVSEKPYAFISYSHRSDNEHYLLSIRMIFQKLKDKEINFWFDDGINTGDNWIDTLKRMNEESDIFIGILTDEYFSRPECWKELIRSVKLQKPAHFFLIGPVTVRTRVPEEFKEVKQLQEELGVTDEDIEQYIAPFKQIGNEDRVLPGNDKRYINMRSPEDPDFLKEFDIIKSKMTKICEN